MAAAASAAAQYIKSEVNTLDPIVPSPPEPGPGTPPIDLSRVTDADAARAAAKRPKVPSRRAPLLLAALAIVPPVGLLIDSGRTVPYFAFTPGDAEPSQPRIKITKATTYDSKGSVLFVTVGVPRLTALAERFARRNPDDEVVQARQVLGDKTPEQNRKDNLKLMGYSKDFATYVALKKLGYEVELKGGGAAIDTTCLKASPDGKSCAYEAPAGKVLKHDDVITAIDGSAIHLSAEIPGVLAGKPAGTEVTITIKRLGQEQPMDVKVALGTSPDDPNRVIVGFIPNESPPIDLGFTFPVDVGIDSGQVGGPSAGLAFTLALLDKLSPGDLTGGVKVAATGTMSPSGTVGPIGGLRQKTVTVQRAGAKVFLVPDSEKADALEQAKGSDLKVIGVNTVDDALRALAELGGNAGDYLGKTA